MKPDISRDPRTALLFVVTPGLLLRGRDAVRAVLFDESSAAN